MLDMRAHRFTTRCTVWVFALAMLLKAAVPLLAAQAAQWQGKALAEVCTVYGVATVAADGTDPTAGHEGGVAHAGEHCTLSGWVVLASAGAPSVAVPVQAVAAIDQAGATPTWQRDACAAWAAQLQHGPPDLT